MKAHVSKSWCCLYQTGYGRSEVHRLPEIENAKERVGPFRRQGCPSRRDPPGRHHQHLWIRPAYGPGKDYRTGGTDSWARDHGRNHREGQRCRDAGGRRSGVGAVQHRMRSLPELPRREDGNLPDRESGSSGCGVRLRRYGRLGRRTGRVCDGALRRFQPAQVPEQREGDGEDHGPDAAVRHLPDRISWRGDSGRGSGHHRLHCGRRSRRSRLRCFVLICWARPSSSSAT